MDANRPINNLMMKNATIKEDVEARFFGKKYPSRGFYIVLPDTDMYLHHDGEVKFGVCSDSDNPAFWSTREEAQVFLDNWVKNHLG